MAKVIWHSGTVEVKAFVLLMLMGLVLCLSNVVFAEETVSAATQQYNQGMDYLNAGQYTQAQEIFESLAADISNKELDFSSQDGIVDVVYLLADCYRKEKDDRAIELYQHILSNYPSHNRAMWAQSGLARCYIQKKDNANAQAAIEKLLADYPDHPDIVEAIGDVASAYGMKGRNGFRTIKLYQYIVSTYSSYNWAIHAQSRLAICYKNKKKHAEAQAAVEKLLADYSDHPDIVEVLDDLAYRYRKEEDNEGSIGLYQYIVSTYPSHNLAMLATKKLAVAAIKAGDEQTARSYCNNIIDNYIAYPGVAREFMLISEEYYNKALSGDSVVVGADPNTQAGLVENEIDPNSLSGSDLYFVRTAEICKCILERMPTLSKKRWLAEVHQMLARSYRNLGMHDLAITHYTTILEACPEYEMGWYIQYSIGKSYQQMKMLGSMSADEADSKTRIAYQQLIDEHPDCNAAKAVRNWLTRNP